MQNLYDPGTKLNVWGGIKIFFLTWTHQGLKQWIPCVLSPTGEAKGIKRDLREQRVIMALLHAASEWSDSFQNLLHITFKHKYICRGQNTVAWIFGTHNLYRHRFYPYSHLKQYSQHICKCQFRYMLAQNKLYSSFRQKTAEQYTKSRGKKRKSRSNGEDFTWSHKPCSHIQLMVSSICALQRWRQWQQNIP